MLSPEPRGLPKTKEFRKIGLSFTDEEMREILGYLYVYGSMMYDMLDNELV